MRSTGPTSPHSNVGTKVGQNFGLLGPARAGSKKVNSDSHRGLGWVAETQEWLGKGQPHGAGGAWQPAWAQVGVGGLFWEEQWLLVV